MTRSSRHRSHRSHRRGGSADRSESEGEESAPAAGAREEVAAAARVSQDPEPERDRKDYDSKHERYEDGGSRKTGPKTSRAEEEAYSSSCRKDTEINDGVMETFAATPTRSPHPLVAFPSPSPSSLRLWRSAALRNMHNQWSHLHTAKAQWLEAAADGRSRVAELVNTHISRRGMQATDLGVLKDMPGFRDKASSKLSRREVHALCRLVKASRSMRCFSKVSPNGSVAQFSERQDDLNDSGDGGGVPVFKWFSILEFESLAQELVEMFVSDLKLKRLLVLELISISFKKGTEHQISLDWGDELYDGESNELKSIGLQSGDEICPLPENWCADISEDQQLGNHPSHEVLQVYLTSWLANVNIKKSRIDKIFELVEEEMNVKLS